MINVDTDVSALTTKTITVKSIKEATISGNTYYYITDEDNQKYKVSITLSDNLPFIKAGSTLKIGYDKETDVINIVKLY